MTRPDLRTQPRPSGEPVIVRGAPDDDEIAAAVAALLLVAGSGTTEQPRGTRRPAWVRDGRYRPPGAWTSG